jgi:hypothetical protein
VAHPPRACIDRAARFLLSFWEQKDATMTHPDNRQSSATSGQPLRDPSDWKTGDEPITAAQRSYLETLATEAGEQLDGLDGLTKAQAAIRIEELQRITGRGQPKQP